MIFKFNSLSELIAAFPDEQTCIEYLEHIYGMVTSFLPMTQPLRCTSVEGTTISVKHR